jgi:hypothetical protein
MRTKFTVLSIVLIFAVMLSACASAGGTPAPVRSVSVTGQAIAYATPDIAHITIGVRSENVDAREAVAANNAQANQLMDALKKLGIDEKDLRTSSFNIYPQDEYDQEGKRTGTRFVVENTIYVTLRDLSKVGDILSGAVEAGANTIYGISFDVEDKSTLIESARNEAIRDARSQAESIATAAGVQLGEIQSINFYNSVPSPVLYDSKVAMAEGLGGGSVPISSGQLEFTVDVNIVYGLK